MEYVLQDCKVLDILVHAQSRGGNSKITFYAKLTLRYFNLCKNLIMHKINGHKINLEQ